MAEKPYWPVVEVRKAANGWFVRPGPSFVTGERLVGPDELYVFQTWDECAAFLRDVTVAASSART